MALLLVVGAALLYVFQDGLLYMARTWARPEYRHGYVVPALALWLLWLRAGALRAAAPRGSWSGFGLVAAGLVGLVLGELSAIYTIVQYSFLLTLIGLVVAGIGWTGARIAWMPLALLVFMIPLPNFLYNNLLAELQLLAAGAAAIMIRALGIAVFVGGNLLDFGGWQISVEEACDALRFLFPLLTLGFVLAAVLVGPAWQRVLVFAMALPLALAMDTARMVVAGMLYSKSGARAAEAWLGGFDGWLVFAACAALLALMAALLARLSGRGLRTAFELRPAAASLGGLLPGRVTPRAVAALVSMAVGVALLLGLQGREDLVPERDRFASFPLRVGDWQGRDAFVEQRMINSLKMDDYLVADFRRPGQDGGPVNLWVAYYANQRKGASAHSPRSCLPGDGFEIESLRLHRIEDVGPAGEALSVNRAVITKGEATVLVYYWFVERGRIQTNEYLVKWYIFWDALTRNRTDGALVRLTTAVPDRLEMPAADRRLEQFVRAVDPVLAWYLPQQDATFEDAQAAR